MGMITLQGFPLRNQLADFPTADGQVDENRYYNCVPTCLAACIEYLDGIKIGADKLKDQVYGQGHVGGGDELRYAPLLAQAPYGLKLSVNYLPSASQAIIDGIRANLRRGVPVIVTMHSAWSTPWTRASGGYHVGVAYSIDESDSGLLHIMNPWRGFDHVQPVAWWRNRLGVGIYPVAKSGAGSVLPDGWHDDGTTLTTANGQPVINGFRAYVLGKLASGLWQGGDAYGPEWGTATASRQIFAATLLEWTPTTGVYEGSLADALTLAAHLREGKAA